MEEARKTYKKKVLGLALAATSLSGACLAQGSTSAHAEALPASSWSTYEATVPPAMNTQDHGSFTVTSPTITQAMVGKTLVLAVTGKTGTGTVDASTFHFHYYDGKQWQAVQNQSLVTGTGATTGLKTPLTQAMVGHQVQAYGLVTMATLPGVTINLASTITVGSSKWTTTTSYSSPQDPLTALPATDSSKLLWVHMGDVKGTPNAAQEAYIASHYHTAILGAQMTSLAQDLRALNPKMEILAYLDLASARTGEAAQAIASGVSYGDAQKNNWLARDNQGRLMPWNNYETQYTTTVWDPAYQKAWTAHAVALATSGPWSGIFADNDMNTLSWYDPTPLQGQATEEASDAYLRDGLHTLIATAGKAINGAGKTFVPNIGESRLRPSDWTEDSSHGGGFEEMFAHWGYQGTTPTVTDGVMATALQNLLANGRAGQQNLVQTQVVPGGDPRTSLYGYASFLLAASPGDVWATDDESLIAPLPQEASIILGSPQGAMEKDPSGVLTRTYARGWVAVNTSSTSSLTVKTPPGAKTVLGQPAGSTVTLPPLTATILATA